MISTYLKRQRLINGAISGLLFTVGLGLTGYGALAMVADYQPEPEVVDSILDELTTHCVKAVEQSGLVISEQSADRISAMNFDLNDPQKQIARISIGIQQCVGYQLAEFCMGSACASAPVTISLQKVVTSNGS